LIDQKLINRPNRSFLRFLFLYMSQKATVMGLNHPERQKNVPKQYFDFSMGLNG